MPGDVMILADAKVGEGKVLVFPQMSTCTALIATVGDTLVGAHATQDHWTGAAPQTYTKVVLDALLDKVDDREIDHLTIAGFNQNHDPAKIRRYLGVSSAVTDAYDISRKRIVEVALVATHDGRGRRPRIDFARQSQATVAEYTDHRNPAFDPSDVGGRLGDVRLAGGKRLRKHFVDVG